MPLGIIGRTNLALAWLLAATVAAAAVYFAVASGFVGQDAHAYWGVRDGVLYDVGPRHEDAYLYSPAFALLVLPFAMLPWPIFFALWTALGTAALLWLIRPLPTRWAVPVGLLCVTDLVIGNVFLLLAAMCALGVRYPAVWAFGVLTKITPGVGVLWFAARGEWRNVRTATLATVAVALVSRAITPDWWDQWATFLLEHSGESGPTFPARCLAALVLVVWGARTDRPWVLPVAVVLALPVHGAVACFVPLVAIPRLMERTKAPAGQKADGGDRVERLVQ